jgi:glycerol kinase
MRISWRKAKRNFLSTTQTLGKPTPHRAAPDEPPFNSPSPNSSFFAFNRWHEHDATEIQEVCDKVIEQAIAKLEEAGYKRSSIKVIGAPPGLI